MIHLWSRFLYSTMFSEKFTHPGTSRYFPALRGEDG